ncbi:uncharacterized protein LOC130051170 [Ostrea edulis]|uniref:uncharacterized protein LOC130051170 n=1 Tax=Ostrea edulis TaxID=37623 RepID=UPI002094A5BE|nr:uncharacterized protein LOC130051170 [Ostrea edulis]
MPVLVVRISDQDGADILSNTATNFTGGTFSELFEKCVHSKNITLSTDSIVEIRLREDRQAQFMLADNADMDVSEIAATLGCKFVQFIITRTLALTSSNSCHEHNPAPASCSGTKNAFALLMHSSSSIILPPKPKPEGEKKLSGPQRLQCDLIDWMESKGYGWTQNSIDTAEYVIKTLRNSLWYVDHAHAKLKESGCPIPKCFSSFHGYNEFKKLHHRIPLIKSERLNELSMDLTKALSFPSMSSSRNKQLSSDLELLLATLTKYKARLDKDNARHKTYSNKSSSPSRSLESDTTLKYIPPKPENESCNLNIYMHLQKDISSVECFRFIDLDTYTPENRLKRRKYISNLELDVPVMLYRMAYGGSIGTLNFIWKVPGDGADNVEVSEKNMKIVNKINKSLPKFSTRSMRKDFINRYYKNVKAPKSLLRNIFFELTGCESTWESSEQGEIDDRVASILLDGDDPSILLDYRSLNGKDVDSKFGVFFEEMGKYFDEQLLHVNERRHGEELYLPMAISIEELRDQISKRVPDGTPIPCSETVRLQFQPNSTFQKTALKYSGRFNVKFRVQTRLARVNHVDARYVATSFRYLKEFCVSNRENVTFVCLDDKAIIPVGEPGIPISTGVRGHNKVLTPSDGPKLVCTDHDFHVAGIVPSVTFVSRIPRHSNDSFFNGKIYVTTKDKVFQPSTPYRHATELTRILREHNSDDNINLNTPVLCLMTDGGPDHRVTFETVKLSLVQLFIQLDLDMLIALRTAPNHSWMNPAERCMSVLNLALQHVALARKDMDPVFENSVKHKSTLSAVRNLANIKTGFREAFAESVGSVVELVNARFKRMKLKNEYLEAYTGIPDEEIQASLDVVCRVLNSDLTVDMSTAELRKMKNLQTFLSDHGSSSHYMFQLKKCSSCAYCTVINPPRLPDDEFQSLHFLPNPVAGEDGQYLSFQEMYGQETGDEHRPSAQVRDDPASVNDRINREIFKTQKVRDVIVCGECSKPRCVYSDKKLTREQEELLLRLKEEHLYTCGDSLVPEDVEDPGMVVREAVNCLTEVETSYFSTSLKHYLPPVCVHCGKVDNLLDDTDPYISALYEKYSVVRPLCEYCKNTGKDARTWGKKFLPKKCKR